MHSPREASSGMAPQKRKSSSTFSEAEERLGGEAVLKVGLDGVMAFR